MKFHRRAVQFFSLLALHASWGPEFKWICNPVLSCHSCALSWFACPIGVFVHMSGYHLFPFFALGTVLLMGVLLGRLLCGWACPFGLVQDLLYKIRTPKFTIPHWTSYLKYVALGVFVFLTPWLLGESTWFSFCRVCPAAALQTTVPNMIAGANNSIGWPVIARLAVLGLVVLLAIYSSRSFCKAFCPVGAILAPLNYLSFWKISVPVENCPGCGKCNRACPVDGAPAGRMAGHIPPNRQAECIVCHDCQNACPRPSKPAAAGTASTIQPDPSVQA